MAKRENWASKLGVILAVAGSAVGLGNFLKFPGMLTQNGGGVFLIPYFVALILIGIPLSWIEWSLGRYGGQFGHGTGPGILNAAVKKPWAKYLGSLSVFGPMMIGFYYIFIESWILGYVYYAIAGVLGPASASVAGIQSFFGSYVGLDLMIFGQFPAAIFFFMVTLLLNFGVLFFGVQRGIERASQIMMPILIVLGIVMLVRVLTLPNIGEGLAFMWNPDFSKLADIDVWFAASGQIFFTLSVGIGAILTYASYVKKNQDVALSSLTANGMNEFLEIIIGGTIVIPAAIVMLGAGEAQAVANAGLFDIGFQTMPLVLGKFPVPTLFMIVWFLLLFVGGLTSSISIVQPAIAFCEDEVNWSRKTSTIVLFFVFLVVGLFTALDTSYNVLSEMDFWGGTFSLILFGTIMAVLFSWVIGFDEGWKELNRGAEIKIPKFFRFIMKYITPTYLIVLLVLWFIKSGVSTIFLTDMEVSQSTFLGMTVTNKGLIGSFRIFMLVFLLGINVFIALIWKKNGLDEKSAGGEK